MSDQQEVTGILTSAEAGDEDAKAALMEAVYGELRDLADRHFRREMPGHLLQPTALVHEAYLRLVDQTRVEWQGRTHFYAVAAQAMRRLLIDHARSRDRQKRGGGWRKATLHDAFALSRDQGLDPIALDDALEAMRRLDARQTTVAELKLLGGLSAEEIARMLDTSVRTVERDWKMAQAWLRRELSRGTAT